MAALQDKETQLNGTVIIYDGLGKQTIAPGRPAQYWKNTVALPVRVAAIHHCPTETPNPITIQGTLAFCTAMCAKIGCRFRLHTGE